MDNSILAFENTLFNTKNQIIFFNRLKYFKFCNYDSKEQLSNKKTYFTYEENGLLKTVVERYENLKNAKKIDYKYEYY